MIKSLVRCAALVALTCIPAVALAGYPGGGFGFRGGFAVPFRPAFSFGLSGLGYPKFSGYYFRTWNGTTSMPQVFYPQNYFSGPVACWHPPLVWPAVAAPSAVIVSTPADPPAMTAGRFHYGGAVRFFP